MNKYDNRRSGRTTKMLMAALKHAKGGRKSVVVIENLELTRSAVAILVGLDYGGIYNAKLRCYTPLKGGPIYITSSKSGTVNVKTLWVDSTDPEDVFWDHEVVRQAHNRILQEFHRYD